MTISAKTKLTLLVAAVTAAGLGGCDDDDDEDIDLGRVDGAVIDAAATEAGAAADAMADSAVVDASAADATATDAGATDGAADATGMGQVITVQALDNRFEPREVTIRPGDTVRWVNAGRSLHTVTSGTSSAIAGSGSLFDRQLAPGDSFQQTFTTVGDQPYFCRFHEADDMRGTVRVMQ